MAFFTSEVNSLFFHTHKCFDLVQEGLINIQGVSVMPTEQNPITSLISKISALVNQIQTHNKPLQKISHENLAKLEQLEKAMEAFVEINNIAAKDAKIDLEKLNAGIASEPISLKDRRLLERAKAIEKDAKRLHLELSKAIQRGKDNYSKEDDSDIEKKKKIKTRQKRFKRLGGDGWMKL